MSCRTAVRREEDPVTVFRGEPLPAPRPSRRPRPDPNVWELAGASLLLLGIWIVLRLLLRGWVWVMAP